MRIEGVDMLQGLESPETRHHDVEHDAVRPEPLDLEQRLEAVARLHHLEALHVQELRDGGAHVLVVVDDQHLLRTGLLGH